MKNIRNRLILGTILLLVFVILFGMYINNAYVAANNRTVHIRQMSNNLILEDLTQDQWIGLADIIVKGKITKVKTEAAEQVVQLKPDSVYKGKAEQEITIYSRNITFEANKTYVIFVGISDVITLDSARYYPVADCVWEVQGDSLDYVPQAFSEISKLSVLQEKIKNSPRVENGKPKKKEIKNGFASLDEKYASANGIFIGKVSEVMNGPAGDAIMFDSASIEIIKGDASLNVNDILVSKKYNVKEGDTILIFTDGRSFLAARSDCLYKINEEGYNENLDYLKSKKTKLNNPIN